MYITPVKRAIYFEIHAWWLNGAATEGLSPYPVRISGRARSDDTGSAHTGNELASKLLAS
jgi:hypothetical protein